MKVIFLDIDGVMNSNVLYEERGKKLGFRLRNLKWKIKKLFIKPKAVSFENYAILDDDSDMLPHQFRFFHHVDGYYGLSPNHLYRIERHFNGLSNYENQIYALQNN